MTLAINIITHIETESTVITNKITNIKILNTALRMKTTLKRINTELGQIIGCED